MSRTFAGLSLERPLVMGIVNATPDSFSDGGDTFGLENALARGRQLAAQGADIIDVGGESTRPGAAPVSIDEEISRTCPVVEHLAREGLCVSIDTRRAAVMEAALEAGAAIINDVTALEGDPRAMAVAAASNAAIILMHMQGEPGTMQQNPTYDDAPGEVFDYLKARVAACEAAGIGRERLGVDPGIGFGKTLEHNLEILAHLDRYAALNTPLVLGVSRKSFIGQLANEPEAKKRTAGSIAAALAGIEHGASIVRVHDVGQTVQALAVWRAIKEVT